MADPDRLPELLDRLARLLSADQRGGGLNAVQHAALDYLARANRFSRQPSHVADYLAVTRGTASQTLKTLVAKGHVRETREGKDRRALQLVPTVQGLALARRSRLVGAALEALAAADRTALEAGLEALIGAMLAARGGRSFGLCRTCRHHDAGPGGTRCTLLGVDLMPEDGGLICVEHAA